MSLGSVRDGDGGDVGEPEHLHDDSLRVRHTVGNIASVTYRETVVHSMIQKLWCKLYL